MSTTYIDFWYMLRTDCGYEKKIANKLSRQRIAHYLPVNEQPSSSYNSSLRKMPLFPGLFFVQCTEAILKNILTLRHVKGVINYVGKAVIVAQEEVFAIKDMLETYPNVELNKMKISLDIVYNKIQHSGEYNVINKLFTNDQSILELPGLGYRLVKQPNKIQVYDKPPFLKNHGYQRNFFKWS
jgi:Transcription termination factor nusG